MTRVYDNWGRLVGATLRREELRFISGVPSDLSSTPSSSSLIFDSGSFRTSSSDFSNYLPLGNSFTHLQIRKATDSLSDGNPFRQGHSGDLYYGVLEEGIKVVIKKINLASGRIEPHHYISKLELFHKGHSRLVPLLGHCSETSPVMYLVYEYMPKKDLSSYLNRLIIPADGDLLPLSPLDWKTRWKIAIGAAKGLCFLHYECNPPIAHRDVQASSIFLDENFEAWLGSLCDICPALEKVAGENRIVSFFRSPSRTGKGTKGEATATRAYDVYCFGKLLLQLITGRLLSDAAGGDIPDPNSPVHLPANDWKDLMLQIYDRRLVRNIMDPGLTVREDVFTEAWAVSIVALACLNPKPSKRPTMAQVVKALKARKISEALYLEMERTIEAQKTFLGPISPRFFK